MRGRRELETLAELAALLATMLAIQLVLDLAAVYWGVDSPPIDRKSNPRRLS